MNKTALYILLIILPACLYSQEYNYVHYDTKDGLAGSTVYDMCQDKDGFMWFATENGLSRFDGTLYKNFTVKDGLPDNEVLKIFADSKGRVWIGTFNKDVCYYFKGKFHTKYNDSTVRKISKNNSLMGIYEYSNGAVLFIDFFSLTVLYNNKVINYKDNDWYDGVNHFDYFFDKGKFIFRVSGININWHTLNHDLTVSRVSSGADNDYYNSFFKSMREKLILIRHKQPGAPVSKIRLPSMLVSFQNFATNQIYYCTVEGCFEIDTVRMSIVNNFLPGKKTTCAVIDKEENLWISTFGEGVYKLPSQNVINYNPDTYGSNIKGNEVFSLNKLRSNILAGLSASQLLLVEKVRKSNIIDYSYVTKRHNDGYIANNRMFTSLVTPSGNYIIGSDFFLANSFGKKFSSAHIFAVKSIAEIDSQYIFVGTNLYAFKIKITDLQITDTIWRERCTKVFYHNNTYYIGTLSGLYEVKLDKTHTYLGNLHPVLSRRITDIKAGDDGALWVSSSDNGIVALKDGSIAQVVDESKGLSSNICRTLFLKDNFLWAGTNKGLNKIDISKPGLPVIHYSISDGLPSDVINAICVDDSLIWVGSPAGLTYFNEKNISSTSICNLNILDVMIADSSYGSDSSFSIPYNKNDISIDYVAVSLKSGGEITYYYRLSGLHNDWRTTKQTNLGYQALPPGDYKLELYAINKFGVRSETKIIRFTIAAPFWKTWWFYTLLALAGLVVVIYILQRRNRYQQNLLLEKNKVQKQFAALEQQALQAQMNPHFIFNCLNSIQQYIVTNDVGKANQYLTGFASLVRQTLDNSEKKTVSVGEEISYLQQYIEMEKMRFGDNFSYEINVDDNVDTGFNELPALLLQPFVENSLRHGLRYKKEGVGKVNISFAMRGNTLVCTITDNGVGRKKAAEYKSQQHIEYQSKGMLLAQKRIDLINKVNQTNIEFEVTDLTDGQGNAAGTSVIIKVPQ